MHLANWLVHWLWGRGSDPDNSSIPYLTAVGDLLGAVLLAVAFYVSTWRADVVFHWPCQTAIISQHLVIFRFFFWFKMEWVFFGGDFWEHTLDVWLILLFDSLIFDVLCITGYRLNDNPVYLHEVFGFICRDFCFVFLFWELFPFVVWMLFHIFDERLFYEMVEGLCVAISLILGRFLSMQCISLADVCYIVFVLYACFSLKLCTQDAPPLNGGLLEFWH